MSSRTIPPTGEQRRQPELSEADGKMGKRESEKSHGWPIESHVFPFSRAHFRPGIQHALTLAAVAAALCLFLGHALAEQPQFRFPPPEFESGYQLPVTTTPAARALWLQYLDVVVLFVSLGLAAYLVLKKRSRKGVVALSIFSLLYFGFYRQGCVCAIGSVQNVALGLFDRGYAVPLTVLAFFLAPLVVALFAGRAFCAAVCPHGAFQDLMLLKPVKVPPWLEQALSVLPFIYLGAGFIFAATGSAFVICRYDPFVPIFRLSGSFVMLSVGAAFLLLGLFVGRPYCRFLCPYGALLRLASAVSKWRVTVTPDVCTQCRLCEESCPYGALREPMAAPANPQALALDRKRLAWLLLLWPALIAGSGWLGSQLTVAASRVHPAVELAERFVAQKPTSIPPGTQTAEALSLMRAQQNPRQLLAAAIEIRQRFVLGGWLFGLWVGLVIGARLISLSVRRRRTDYEPDRAACLACARCFVSCPNERVRLGLMPATPVRGATVSSPALLAKTS